MYINIRNYEQNDWSKVREIYLLGIKTNNATFELEVPEREDWEKRHLGICRLVAISDSEVVGWAALLPVSEREVYRGVAEVSVYISPAHSGKGIGKKLLTKLINESEANGIWTLQASIFPENIASIKLHKSCGFRIVGTREKIGKMKGTWRDTVLLERRSKSTGI